MTSHMKGRLLAKAELPGKVTVESCHGDHDDHDDDHDDDYDDHDHDDHDFEN